MAAARNRLESLGSLVTRNLPCTVWRRPGTGYTFKGRLAYARNRLWWVQYGLRQEPVTGPYGSAWNRPWMRRAHAQCAEECARTNVAAVHESWGEAPAPEQGQGAVLASYTSGPK